MTWALTLLLPLIGYFWVEYIYGWFWGLAFGVALSWLIPGLKAARGGGFNYKSALADTVLVAAFSGADLMTSGLPDAASSFATATILSAVLWGIVAIGTRRALGGMVDGLRPGMSRNPYFIHLLRGSVIRMSLWSIVASLLFLYAFLTADTPAADWIESYALITVLLAYLATEIIVARCRKSKYKSAEWVPLMTEDGQVIGGAPRPLVHNGSLWLHPVVHLHVFSSDGKLLLQLRPKTKKIQPGRWDTAVGGHITYGEKLQDALKRETVEEIGLTAFDAQLIRKYVWKCKDEHEYVFVFRTHSDGPFNPRNVGEVDELRFWSKEELANAIGKGLLTPNLENELSEGLLELVGRRIKERR